MDTPKVDPPPYSPAARETEVPAVIALWRRRLRRCRWWTRLTFTGLLCFSYLAYLRLAPSRPFSRPEITALGLSVSRLEEDLSTCGQLRAKPVDPIGLGRKRSSRYVDGQKPTLITNATVWVGEPADGEDLHSGASYSWITADILLEYGLVKRVEEGLQHTPDLPGDVLVYDAGGRPLTSGIIDMHSHAGVHSLPTLHGNEDVSELSTNITPYVRSIDGIQPLDQQLQVIKSGGVTTSLILPGSSNNIGGEAFVIKHAVGHGDGRNETSVTDMLADSDHTWRYMKMACGENAKRVHGKPGERGPTSRMGESWELRHAFEKAAEVMRMQDEWCNLAGHGIERVVGYLPYELEWEALVAVLRGKVQVHVHCYTIPDLEAFVGHSNEFQFHIGAFHHAHQAYLVPDILKQAWGDDPPALALFADNMWYKAEALGSEYAGKHLYDNGLTPIYVSDNPILNAQHVVFEAAKAYRYGLPYHAALASVTSAPAELLGLGNRLGKVKAGFDADIVVWDSDPLSVGAAPVQVWIDGTAQFEDPVELDKQFKGTAIPNDKLGHVGGKPATKNGEVVFTGITKSLLDSDTGGLLQDGLAFNLVISNGSITCMGRCDAELEAVLSTSPEDVFHLENGHLTPSFTAFGSTLGLNAIESERDTDNGADGDTFSRGIDGLAVDTEKLHVAHRYGITHAISCPKFARENTHHGTSVGFYTGATGSIASGATFVNDAALHYTMDLSAKGNSGTPSISAAVGSLRGKLLNVVTATSSKVKHSGNEASEAYFLRKVVNGQLPLAITVHSADTIASVLRVKRDVEKLIDDNGGWTKLRLVIIGGAEAHLLADDLAAARVGVVLAPFQSFAVSWDQRRALSGAPLTNMTAVDLLMRAGAVTAIGLEEDWILRDLTLLAGVAHANSEGAISENDAMDLISRNVYKMLGLAGPDWHQHFVVHEGNPLEIDSKVKAVGDGTGKIHLL